VICGCCGGVVGRHRRPCPCRRRSLAGERHPHKRSSSPGGGRGRLSIVDRCGGAHDRSSSHPLFAGGCGFSCRCGGRPGAPQSGSEEGRRGADPQPSDGSRTVSAHIERPGCDPPFRNRGWRLCAPGSTPTRRSLQSFQSRRPAPRQPAHASRRTRREPGRAVPHAVLNDHNFATPGLRAGGWEETGAESARTVQPSAIKRGVGKLWRSPG
jgi:hypothetical protein